MSERRLVTGLQLAGASVLLVSYAQLAQKWGMMRLPPPQSWQLVLAQPAPYGWELFAVCSGLAAYLVSMACWVGALGYLPLNRAYPMLGLSYGLVYLSGAGLPWYHEQFSLQGVAGVVLIALGVVVINLRPNE